LLPAPDPGDGAGDVGTGSDEPTSSAGGRSVDGGSSRPEGDPGVEPDEGAGVVGGGGVSAGGIAGVVLSAGLADGCSPVSGKADGVAVGVEVEVAGGFTSAGPELAPVALYDPGKGEGAIPPTFGTGKSSHVSQCVHPAALTARTTAPIRRLNRTITVSFPCRGWPSFLIES
jgi:hypothetical protein